MRGALYSHQKAWSVQVIKQVAKSTAKDFINGAKWVIDKVSTWSFDDNFNNPGPLKKTVIMSPSDIPYLVCYICTECDALKGVLVGRKNK